MKSFLTFNENVDASKIEASNREKRSQNYTQEMKKKLFSKSKQAIRKFLDQKKKAQKFKDQQLAQKEIQQKKAKKTSQDLSKVAKTTHKMGKHALGKVKSIIQSKKDTSQSGT